MAGGATEAIVRQDGEGERLWFYGGGVHTWKATAAETGGSFILFEDDMTQGKVTPLHSHPFDETMYVLEGEILVHMAGREHRIGPRGMAIAPRGVAHAFLVTSETARLLCLGTPGSGEGFSRSASESLTDEIRSAGPVDFDRLRASAERHGGIEILGPPPFQPTTVTT